MAGERINVSKVVDGKVLVQSVQAEKLAAAQDAGWDIAAPEETQQYKYEREVMARPGAAFEAGFEGFSRAVTLGGSDAVLAAIVDDDERQAMQVRSTDDAAAVGEGLGTAATLLSATGALRAIGGRAAAAEGSALLRGGGRALQLTDGALARTPLGLVARGAAKVGEAVERKVIGDATAGVARKALARGVGLGTEGAIEGAVVGAGQEVSEAALGDTELTAQKLLAGAGKGALFGGLTGVAIGAPLGAAAGALGAPRALAGRAAREAGDALGAATASAAGHVAPDIARSLGDKATDLYSTVASKVSGKAKSEIEFGIRNRDARADYWRLEELKRASTERTASSLDEMKTLQRLEKRIASRDFGSESLAKTIRRDPGAVSLQTSNAARLVGEMTQESGRLAGSAEAKLLLTTARESIAAAAKAKDPSVATHQAIESLQRGLDDIRSRAQGGANTPEVSRLHEWADINARRADTLLNDGEVWGTAGAQRAERSAAIDAVRKTKRDFDGRFFQAKSSDAADPGKIAAHFDRIGDASKDYSHVQSLRHLDERLRLYDVLEQNGDIPADMIAELAKARAVTTKLKADFSEMGDRIGGANRVASLYAEDAFTRMMGGTPATIVGSLTGGPAGAAAGFAVDALRNPGALIQRLGAIESLADRVRRVDAKIGNSVRAFVRQETAPALREGSERKVRRAIRASSAATAGVVATEAHSRKRAKEVQRKVDAVRAYARDPVPSTDAFVRRTMRGVSDYAPQVAMGIAGTHARAMQFLATKLPPIPRTQLSVLQPQLEGHVLAPSQVEQLGRYIRAIEEPVEIIEDMRTGLLSPEAVEAIQAVYPDLYASMRTTAILEVASAKEPLSHTAVVRLSLMFDFAGSPTLEPGFQMTHSALMGERQQSAPQTATPTPSDAPDMTSSTQTMSQRLVVGM